MDHVKKYPLPMRLIHWLRAVLIFGVIWAGWTMVSLDENDPTSDIFYAYHKSFGILVFILVVTQLTLRARVRLPSPAACLARWELIVSRIAHWLLYALMLVVPLLGYARSSTYSQSDGVFFFFGNLPELLAKNDALSSELSTLHRISAYTLLALVVLHIAGAVKHRLFDRSKADDPLSQMI